MSSEGFVLQNPRGNNRDLEVSYPRQDGTSKKIKTLRPGEAMRCDRRQVIVTSVLRPPRLVLGTDGTYGPDLGR